jgi:Fibrobacter succinogenes major domain (Fib_succ_major).
MKSIDSILSRLFLTVFVLISCIVTLNAQDDGHTMTVEMNNGTKLSLNTDEVKEVTFADGKIVVSGADLMRTIGHMSDSLKLSLYRIDDLERTILDSLITNSYRIENLKDKISSLGDTISRYRTLIEKNRNLIEYNKALIDSYHGSNAEQNHEYVDLGLSVKWATCNVGATKPEEYGDYFAWGETEPKTDYRWFYYKWCNCEYGTGILTLTKYCNNSEFGNNGFTDTKTTLDPEDDVAHVQWGGTWRMPTMADWDELRKNCIWTWYSSDNTEFNGVAGYKVTSNIAGYRDRFIFLPAAGSRENTSPYNAGTLGNYWSSTLYTESPIWAWFIVFESSREFAYENARNYGRSVRPVCP